MTYQTKKTRQKELLTVSYIEELQEYIKELYTHRSIHYSPTIYYTLKNSPGHNNIPEELYKLWYSPDDLSSVSLNKTFDEILTSSDVNALLQRIGMEYTLIKRLEKCFLSIETSKGGDERGKN